MLLSRSRSICDSQDIKIVSIKLNHRGGGGGGDGLAIKKNNFIVAVSPTIIHFFHSQFLSSISF